MKFFLNPNFFWHLLWIIPLMVLVFWWAVDKRRRLLGKIFGGRQDNPEYVSLSSGKRTFRFLLLFTAIIFMVIAAARPHWGSKPVEVSQMSRDIMVVLDVSKSMLCRDVKPSRLQHAKWFLRQLVSDTFGDRYGLIAFAGNAFLECPLTSDRTSFFQFLDDISVYSIPLGGTNVQEAINTALMAFKNAKSGEYRAILLVTDGDELTGNSQQAIAMLKQMQIPLFIVGVGDPSQPGLIPDPDKAGKFIRDNKGELVNSKVNEPLLKKLATETGGTYVRSTLTHTGLEEIIKRIAGLVPAQIDQRKESRIIERLHLPLFVAVLLLLLWMAVSERRSNGKSAKMSKKAAIVTALLLPGIFFGSGAVNAQETKPEKKAEKTKAEKKVNPVEVYNQALALQMKKQPKPKEIEQAGKLYQQAINESADKPQVRAGAFQNLGVMHHSSARGEVMKSMQQVKGQNLDGALKTLDAAAKTLDGAEKFYLQSMRSGYEYENALAQEKEAAKPEEEKIQTVGDLAMNQQKLLNDRQFIKELKKKIEELKKQQKKAQKKTQQAKKKQQKQNQDKQKQQQQKKQKKDQKKQDKQQQQKQNQQQKQQQQKQNQQKRDESSKKQQDQDRNQQQQANKAREEAQKAVKNLKDKAKELDQKKLEQDAKKAEEELEKAAKAQKENKGKEAEKHLKKALEHLAKQQQRQKDQQKKDQKKQKSKGDKGSDKDKKDKKEQNKGDKDKNKKDNKLPEMKEMQKAKAARKKEKEIDENQAEALLEEMARDERKLNKAIKAYRKRLRKMKPVEKDW